MSFIPFNPNQCNHNYGTKNLGGCYSHVDDDKPCLESRGDAGKISVARQLPQSVVCSILLVVTHSGGLVTDHDDWNGQLKSLRVVGPS
jgi:hypothetical protein